MRIETYSRESMISSLCDCLSISQKDLLENIEKFMLLIKTDSSMNLNTLNDLIANFAKQQNYKPIDSISLFHLTRRLNDYKGSESYNLAELLTTNNSVSAFLKKHEIKFKDNTHYLDLYYKGKLQYIDVENYSGKCNVHRLKNRLGYCKDRQDFCINGFAFKDQIYKNTYARSLFYAPEFITDLGDFLNIDEMALDYNQNSKYYCFEYILPLTDIIFDGEDGLSNEEKEIHLILEVFQRIYSYTNRYIFDHDNPLLKLDDSANISNKCFVSKEEIFYEMLWQKR